MKKKWVGIALITLSLVLVGGTIMACTIASPIVGEWQNTQKNNVYIEFFRDGRVVNTDGRNVISGKYEIIGDEYVKVTFEGVAGAMLALFGAETWKFQISGDILRLEGGGQSGTFRRVR